MEELYYFVLHFHCFISFAVTVDGNLVWPTTQTTLMAQGGTSLLPSAEKTNFLRLIALLIDGGTLALKTQFDLHFPPVTLSQDLQASVNYQILRKLTKKRILTSPQSKLLFPPAGKTPESSEFDLSLLSCLVQVLPAFQQQNSPVWKTSVAPATTDKSLAADVKRLRCLRNEVS